MSSSRTDATAVVEVTMPQMGVSVAEGTVAEWKKQVGDHVEADETIVEISTDKVETEVPSPATGTVSEILVEVGTTVDVGTVLARIDTGGGAAAERAEEAAGPAAAAEERTEPQPAGAWAAPPNGAAQRTQEPAGGAAAGRPAGDGARAANGGAAPVSPVVRRIADEQGVDLSQVEGTGRRGRVTKKDVLAFLERREAEPAAAPAEPALHMESPYREEEVPAVEPAGPAAPAPEAEPVGQPPTVAPTLGAERGAAPAPAGEPLSIMRRQIGEHMRRSLDTAAHCTTIVEADMSRIDRAREAQRLSYLPFVSRAVIGALREFPSFNATLDGDRITIYDEVHLGIAVSLGENGLIVPVVRNAHELSHEGLAARIKDLAERARSKRLKPDEVGGATFTITNPGAFGALLATPIINQPQVAILDLEAVVKRPVVVSGPDGDSIAIRPMTYLCMSWDHRALDGAIAAQFLSSVRRHVEEWSG